MKEVGGYIGERHGTRVIVMRVPGSNPSDYDMMMTAVDIIREEL